MGALRRSIALAAGPSLGGCGIVRDSEPSADWKIPPLSSLSRTIVSGNS